MSQADMTEAIRLERRLDLAFEGHRFFDVRRWMIAEDTDNRMMHGFEITRMVSRRQEESLILVSIPSVKRCIFIQYLIKRL